MTNFKVGQKVVCIKQDGSWRCVRTGTTVGDGMPKYLEVCVIKSFCDQVPGNLILVGYEYFKDGRMMTFRPKWFKPLEYQSANQEILQKFPLTEEKADVKVKEVPITQDCE